MFFFPSDRVSGDHRRVLGQAAPTPSWLGSLLPPNISHLNLELNKIEGPILADMGDVINITLMNLSSNQLNGTVPDSICGLRSSSSSPFPTTP